MEITEEDRLRILDEIKEELGFVERNDDEFTAAEIAHSFGVAPSNVITFFKKEEVKYKRRKAIADGRRQFVYKLEKE